MRKVSVIIPTYNSYHTLKDAIKSLKSQTLQPLEIIIIDNASSDGTTEKIKKDFPSIKLVTMKKNTGVTGGRNEGVKYLSPKADVVMFFDHDMVANKNMIKELVSVLDSQSDIGIVTPKIFYWDKKNIIWAAGTDVNLITGQTLFRGGEDIGQYEKIEEVAVAPAVLLVDRKLIDKKLKFDDIYFATYEDTDYCFKAKKMGFLTYYTPRAYAYHKIPYDHNDANIRLLSRTYFVARNRVIFMKRFGKSFFIFLLLTPAYFIYYSVLSLKYSKVRPIFEYVRGLIDGFGYLLR